MKTQRPTPPNEWLYSEEDESRYFFKIAGLPDNAPLFPECTDAEKQAWEEEHRPEPEIQEAEEV